MVRERSVNWREEWWNGARVAFWTMGVCCVLYPLAVWVWAQGVVPQRAEGSLLHDRSGRVVGSRLLAQAFTEPRYFWPRPSAVGWDGAASGGSNLSPTANEWRRRIRAEISRHAEYTDSAVAPDLVMASGSGLDPHITWRAACLQAPRVARARGCSLSAIMAIMERHAETSWLCPGAEPLVNVLALNLEIERGGDGYGR